MTSFTETFTRIRCNACAVVYHGRSSDVKTLRRAARAEGWTAGRAPRSKTIPRFYDACPDHMVPQSYIRI